MSDFVVLVVDDSPTMRRIIRKTLSRAGYNNYIEAEDGKDALEKIQSEQIDIIITDMNMPEMDGLTLITTLQAEDTTKHIPILVVSTRIDSEEVLKCIRAGADDFIVKPFTSDALKAKIESILAK